MPIYMYISASRQCHSRVKKPWRSAVAQRLRLMCTVPAVQITVVVVTLRTVPLRTCATNLLCKHSQPLHGTPLDHCCHQSCSRRYPCRTNRSSLLSDRIDPSIAALDASQTQPQLARRTCGIQKSGKGLRCHTQEGQPGFPDDSTRFQRRTKHNHHLRRKMASNPGPCASQAREKQERRTRGAQSRSSPHRHIREDPRWKMRASGSKRCPHHRTWGNRRPPCKFPNKVRQDSGALKGCTANACRRSAYTRYHLGRELPRRCHL